MNDMIIIWYKSKNKNKIIIFIQINKFDKIQRFIMKIIIKYYKIIIIIIIKIEMNL